MRTFDFMSLIAIFVDNQGIIKLMVEDGIVEGEAWLPHHDHL